MRPRVMIMEEDWDRIKNEELSFILENDQKASSAPVMMVASADPREGLLKTLVQQAARN